jgi:hypothetical protein
MDKKMDEVEKAFLKALEDANTMEWGSSEQIESENLPFALAKAKGWNADTDRTFQDYALKATTEELLAKGLELYRLKGSLQKFMNNVYQDLKEMKKLGINVPKKAFVMAQDPDVMDKYENMKIAECSNLLISLGQF